MIFVSACLAGVPCRYDGRCSRESLDWLDDSGGAVLLICPEVLGGLKTPREPCELCGGCVRTAAGDDRTAEYIAGAQEVLRLARLLEPERIYLKAKSPSCGLGTVYDGSFTHTLVHADGLTAHMLTDAGFEVTSVD